MLTTVYFLVVVLATGFFARRYSRRIQLLMLAGIVVGIALLIRG